jgi:hypothetical protein
MLDEADKFSKNAQIEFFGPLLGQGILTSEGPNGNGSARRRRRCSGGARTC